MEVMQTIRTYWVIVLAKLKQKMKNSQWPKRDEVQEGDTNPARRLLQMKVKMNLKVRAMTCKVTHTHRHT